MNQSRGLVVGRRLKPNKDLLTKDVRIQGRKNENPERRLKYLETIPSMKIRQLSRLIRTEGDKIESRYACTVLNNIFIRLIQLRRRCKIRQHLRNLFGEGNYADLVEVIETCIAISFKVLYRDFVDLKTTPEFAVDEWSGWKKFLPEVISWLSLGSFFMRPSPDMLQCNLALALLNASADEFCDLLAENPKFYAILPHYHALLHHEHAVLKHCLEVFPLDDAACMIMHDVLLRQYINMLSYKRG